MGPRSVIYAAVLLLSPAIVGAQAWTPPAGQGTVWLSIQTLHADAHLQGNGITAEDIDIRANTLTLGVDYGLTDRLAVGLSVPYVSARFINGKPHVGSTVDDGETHRAPTDVRIDLRYKAINSNIVMAPSLSVVLPTHEYETLGHAAPGRGLTEYSAGFDVGYNAISISPSLFLGGGYRYSLVERIDEHVTVNRSNADLQADYLLTQRLAVRGSVMWQKTHGGLDLPLAPAESAEHRQHHDQLARANFWHSSVGLSYGLTPTVDVFGTFATVIEGVNSHRFRSWSGGVAWRFGQPSRDASGPRS